MNQLQKVFNYKGKQVRTVLMNSDPWWVAKDICLILDLDDTGKAINRLDMDERNSIPLTDSLGREQETYIVNEPGLYSLILGSRKPEARAFKRWVTHEVLPEIRKTGQYIQVPKSLPEALRAYADEVEKREEAEKRVLALAPKAAFFDAVADSKDAIQIGEAAKVLGIPGIGRNKLFKLLRDRGILMQNNQPYQEFVDRGYFRVIEQSWIAPDGETKINIKTLVYQRGLDYIRKLLTKKAG